MGFGIGSIGDAFKSAVQSVGDAVGSAAKAVGDGAQAVEHKVADVVHSAMESVNGQDGFDGSGGDEPTIGPLADSKPKGGTRRADTGGGDTAVA